LRKGRTGSQPSPARSRATFAALRREGHAAAMKPALARQARSAARERGPKEMSSAAKKAARTRKRGQAATEMPQG
jgi:hypothetical protein